jgi:hypothetical protein
MATLTFSGINASLVGKALAQAELCASQDGLGGPTRTTNLTIDNGPSGASVTVTHVDNAGRTTVYKF